MMWMLREGTRASSTATARAALRLRSKKNTASTATTASRFSSTVAVQLDYYMSPQFGGVAAAVAKGLYKDAGLDVSFLPICPVGEEPLRVRKHQADNPGCDACFGSVEQNVLIPALRRDPSLRVAAVAAMFRTSPLCVASISTEQQQQDGGGGPATTIGAHEDTVELLQRIFPSANVVASPRATKVADLLNGTVGAIQAYTTTEVPTLRANLGKEPSVTVLEGENGAKIGYGQVLFASEESLATDDRRGVAEAFLKATFEGWETVVADPEEGLKMVWEAQKELGLDDENNDHWHPSTQMEMLVRCNDHVKETADGSRLGVIDGDRYDAATRWLLDDPLVDDGFGRDGTALW